MILPVSGISRPEDIHNKFYNHDDSKRSKSMGGAKRATSRNIYKQFNDFGETKKNYTLIGSNGS